jgi:pyridoxamine 5'-phosphate oxidase
MLDDDTGSGAAPLFWLNFRRRFQFSVFRYRCTDVPSLADLRRDYARHSLSEHEVDRDPFRQFHVWFDEARAAETIEPNAMSLATATPAGVPSVRVVLLKEFDERGFVFFTDYRSRKGEEMAANPQAALCFWWGELQRQVRLQGRITKVSQAESEAYYRQRPRGSRLGAWASTQSSVIPSREQLESAIADLEQRYEGKEDIPLPDHWGGYRLQPVSFEFWQGRPSRLHDRIEYTRDGSAWTVRRLSP